ncbi:MAG: hypothetical protein ACJ8BW_35255 [Ktedonobacteraceae bacterium]
MGKLRRGIARFIDSYADGLIDKQEFEPRVTRMRERLQHLEEQLQRLKDEAEVEEESRLILGRLETFAAKVQDGLHQADFQTRREIIRALVKRVEVDTQQIRIVFRISLTSLPPSSDGAPTMLPIVGGVCRSSTTNRSSKPCFCEGWWSSGSPSSSFSPICSIRRGHRLAYAPCKNASTPRLLAPLPSCIMC